MENIEDKDSFNQDNLSNDTKSDDSSKKNKKGYIVNKVGIQNMENKTNHFIICKTCHCGVFFYFKNCAISFFCNCTAGINKSLGFFKTKFLVTKEYYIKKNIEIKCNKHNKKYESFCIDCLENKYVNLCEECMVTHKKDYKNHNPTFFKDTGNLIKMTKELLNDGDFKKEFKNKFYRKINELINILIDNFEEYPCYNYYASILEAYNLLSQLKQNKVYTNINSIENLSNTIKKGNTDSINSIVILGDKNNISKETLDFELLSNKKLSNLQNVTIKYITIKNLNKLLENKLEKLEKFVFEECKFEEINKIDFDKLKYCNNLKYLSFYKIKISDTKLLYFINNNKLFPKLETLYIGGNLFKEIKLLEMKNNNKDFKISLNRNIQEIGITGNFDAKTNEFIKYFDFNPITLYISRNKLSSLKVIENFHFERLEEFWAVKNKITDLNELKKYLKSKTVRIINLNNNPIENIDNLEEIIDHFPKLEKLSFTYKKYKKALYKDKIEKIKKKRKNFKLEINRVVVLDTFINKNN